MAARKRSRRGTESAATPTDETAVDTAGAEAEPVESERPTRRPRRPRPVWMIPTADGLVPEHELNRRRR